MLPLNSIRGVRTSTVLLVALVIFLLLGGVVFFQQYHIAETKRNLEFAKKAYAREQYERGQEGEKLVREMITVQDSLGKQVQVEKTRVEVVEADRSQLRWMLDAQDRFLTQRLKDFEVKLKDLKSVTNLKVETSGQFITVTQDSVSERRVTRFQKPDSIVKTVFRTFSYDAPDGWYTMTGYIKGDSVQVTPLFRNEFDVAILRRRKEKRYFFDWFRSKETVAEVINRNPYSSTQKFKTIIQK